MNLVVLGATGGTGRLVVAQALAAGHTVTALVRSPEKLTLRNPNLRVIPGQPTDPSAVSHALDGADAVISTLGGNGSVISESTRAIVEAANMAGVSRVVVLSSFLVERDRLNPITRLLTGLAMGSMIKDKSAGEKALRDSDLDWTIVYASGLTDGPAGGSVVVLTEGSRWSLSHRIARTDVAAWLVQEATSPQTSRRTLSITGGTRTKENLQSEAARHV
jgi:uncharacterized protein YbjT (DUF2867 family)